MNTTIKTEPTNALSAQRAVYPRLDTFKIANLRTHPDKLRKMEPADLYRLGKSLERFGLLRPPTFNAETGNLLDGDQLVEALKARGVEEVRCWVVSVPKEEEDVAHLVLQNHVGEWLWQPVSEVLKRVRDRGGDVGLTGFHDSDTGPLLAADWTVPAKGPMDGSDAAQVELFQ
jgi:hypothetical protein